MFFLWPTLNDRTLSGTRSPRRERLDSLEQRMHEFLAAKSARAGECDVVDRVEAQRRCVSAERGQL
ncbi:MAG: hypothetical protein KDJ48_00675 [Nitratireductor sp.]|nr:hypothetical protein [Nitratireductor sp.]MCB1457784.1 hypothetical protein [Nitratireductor sp.]